MHAEYRVCVKKSNMMDVTANKTQVSIQETIVQQSEDEMNIRKGLWSVKEDTILANYVTTHGHGCWNSVAKITGLKRSGKSCRLRWLNYLRPGVRHGNITLQEQIMILDLHSQWGNRWSKIAQHLPGRTDNEIKNYWRTRVKKQAKQLNCDVDSKRFKDCLRYVWMPLLIERAHPPSAHASTSQLGPGPIHVHHQQNGLDNSGSGSGSSLDSSNIDSLDSSREELQFHDFNSGYCVSPKQLGHNVGLNNQMLQEENGNLPYCGDDDGDDLLEKLLNDENIWLCDDLVMNDDDFLV